ncbi:MAG: AraC family transcriptional regulator [Ruminococcaceae bacterium]|nr:AraC family transcriptional regulator [Oscillospiraceae bacterium]
MLVYNRFTKNYPLICRISNIDINTDISIPEIGYNRVPNGLHQLLKRDIYILHYIENGKGIYMDTHFDKTCGYLTVPNEIERIVADDEQPYESCWIMFRGNLAKEMLKQCHLSHNCVFPFKYNRECFELIKETIFREDYANEYEEAYTMHSLFYKIMALHMKDMEESEPISLSVVQQVARLIEKNYYNPISITKLANTFHMSRNYLYTLFKQEYGVSPQEYLISLRIEKAKKLLKGSRSNLSIKEVAISVGFDNPLYFSRIFHNRTGMSPSRFIKENNVF